MKIVDMARSEADYMGTMPAEPNPYPCGLSIRLGTAELKKLGITEMPELGSQIAFYVCGEVCSTSESNEYGEDKCIGVQIQQMALEEPPAQEEEEARDAVKGGFREAASKLYGKQK